MNRRTISTAYPKSCSSLPEFLFASPPPNQTGRRRALIFVEHILHRGEEVRLIGKVARPLKPHEEPAGNLIIKGDRAFLQGLGSAAKPAASVREIFNA